MTICPCCQTKLKSFGSVSNSANSVRYNHLVCPGCSKEFLQSKRGIYRITSGYSVKGKVPSVNLVNLVFFGASVAEFLPPVVILLPKSSGYTNRLEALQYATQKLRAKIKQRESITSVYRNKLLEYESEINSIKSQELKDGS